MCNSRPFYSRQVVFGSCNTFYTTDNKSLSRKLKVTKRSLGSLHLVSMHGVYGNIRTHWQTLCVIYCSRCWLSQTEFQLFIYVSFQFNLRKVQYHYGIQKGNRQVQYMLQISQTFQNMLLYLGNKFWILISRTNHVPCNKYAYCRM